MSHIKCSANISSQVHTHNLAKLSHRLPHNESSRSANLSASETCMCVYIISTKHWAHDTQVWFNLVKPISETCNILASRNVCLYGVYYSIGRVHRASVLPRVQRFPRHVCEKCNECLRVLLFTHFKKWRVYGWRITRILWYEKWYVKNFVLFLWYKVEIRKCLRSQSTSLTFI